MKGISRFSNLAMFIDGAVENSIADYQRRGSLVPLDELARMSEIAFVGAEGEVAMAAVEQLIAGAITEHFVPERAAEVRALENLELLDVFGPEVLPAIKNMIRERVTLTVRREARVNNQRSTQRIVATEEHAPAFDTGVWESNATYSRGAMATYQGTLWSCQVDLTTDKPGTSKSWRLMVKNHPRQDRAGVTG
jgi:hypothetical protein